MWFDKKNPAALYIDNRVMEAKKLTNGATFSVEPDIVMDFRELQFEDETFPLVVFDPPHYSLTGNGAWLREKYGSLDKENWREDLKKGFEECFRVLKPDGVLIFKWNEYEIPVSEVLKLTPYAPLFGHKSGKAAKTHWLTFMKIGASIKAGKK